MLTVLTALSLAVLGGASVPDIPKPQVQACQEVQSRPPVSPKPTKKLVKAQLPKSAPIAPGEIDLLINKYAVEYGTDPGLMKRIAQCESRFNPNAQNGQYSGMYQFGHTTWVSTRQQMGLPTDTNLRYSAEESIKTAAFKLANGGKMAWKACL